MIAETILTLVVTILGVDQGVATLDRGRLAGLRAGDTGRIYYQLTVGATAKRIDVGEGTLVEVEDSRSRLRVEGDVAVRPSYLVEFQIPLRADGGGAGSAGIDPALRSLIERLAPGEPEVQAEVARLIRERRIERAAGSDELRGQLERAEIRQHRLRTELDRARADVIDLRRQLEQAESARWRLQGELDAARSVSVASADPVPIAPVAADTASAEAETVALAEPDPVAPVETPAAGPVSASRQPEVVADPKTEILSSVEGWARAWSEQRVDDYLSFYARGFRPPEGKSRRQWEADRRPRVLAPRFIDVQLSELEILSMNAGRAEVKLRQRYRSDQHNIAGTKFLELVRDDGRWKIVSERIE